MQLDMDTGVSGFEGNALVVLSKYLSLLGERAMNADGEILCEYAVAAADVVEAISLHSGGPQPDDSAIYDAPVKILKRLLAVAEAEAWNDSCLLYTRAITELSAVIFR